jgi:hypothetical protein
VARPRGFEPLTFAFGGQSALEKSFLFKGLYGCQARNIAGNGHMGVTEPLLTRK